MSSRFVVHPVSWEEVWRVNLGKYTISVPKLLMLEDTGTGTPRLKNTWQLYAVLKKDRQKIKTFFFLETIKRSI
jgi:hypothetical protein